MHHLMRRQGWVVGRDQITRVMKTCGITGVRRGRTTFTTRTKTTDAYPWTRWTVSSLRHDPANYGSQILRMWRPL